MHICIIRKVVCIECIVDIAAESHIRFKVKIIIPTVISCEYLVGKPPPLGYLAILVSFIGAAGEAIGSHPLFHHVIKFFSYCHRHSSCIACHPPKSEDKAGKVDFS